jgi:hypothetical protein
MVDAKRALKTARRAIFSWFESRLAVKGHLKAILKGAPPSGKISGLKKINPFYGVIIFFIYKKFDSAILACSNNASLFLFVHIENIPYSARKRIRSGSCRAEPV